MAAAGSGRAIRRIVLLGIMGAGKSTVGRLLARRLGWRHIDLDREIERREGRSIASIFAAEGEPYFRRREADLTEELAGSLHSVISPGGGWITTSGVLERLGPGTYAVWLRVSPEEVVARLAGTGEERPLLRGPDPQAAVERLLAEREPLYRRADLAVRTDGREAESIVNEILQSIGPRGDAPPAG